MPEFMDQDRIYLDLDNDRIEWMYYNPDSVSEGQFVTNVFDRDLLEEALEGMVDAEDAFDYIGTNCRQYLADKGTEFYGEAWKRMETAEPFAIGCTLTTLDELRLAYRAKDLIDEYCIEEFGSPADYEDLRAIGIGYTTITDAEHGVQAYANLLDHRIEIYLNDQLAEYRQYESLRDMTFNGLPNLDFMDLIAIPDWVIADYERKELIDDLAIRLVFYMKEYDPYGYADCMEVGETDADMVAKMKAELGDVDAIPPTIREIETMVREGDLSEVEKTKCYAMMTDLHHIYAEQKHVPVYDRETDILYTAFDAMGLEGFEIHFDEDGICLTRDGDTIRNRDIYQYLSEFIMTPDVCRAFRDKNFEGYTDFVDLAAHYDVRVGAKLDKPVPPVGRIDFLSSKGVVGDSVEVTEEYRFVNMVRSELDAGVPIIVVLYRGEDGKTISQDFLKDLDTLPKGFVIEDAPQPHSKPHERSDAR